jgi:hypothetical protein
MTSVPRTIRRKRALRRLEAVLTLLAGTCAFSAVALYLIGAGGRLA